MTEENGSEVSESERCVLDHIARLVFDLDPASSDPVDFLVSYQSEYHDYLEDGNFIDVSMIF